MWYARLFVIGKLTVVTVDMPVRVHITEGIRAECKEVVHLIEGISAETLLANRSYRTNTILSYAASTGMETVIPPKKDRKEQCKYDEYFYKLRHLVENCFLFLKRWRGIATRYAKTAEVFITAVYRFAVSLFGLPFGLNSCRHYLN